MTFKTQANCIQPLDDAEAVKNVSFVQWRSTELHWGQQMFSDEEGRLKFSAFCDFPYFGLQNMRVIVADIGVAAPKRGADKCPISKRPYIPYDWLLLKRMWEYAIASVSCVANCICCGSRDPLHSAAALPDSEVA